MRPFQTLPMDIFKEIAPLKKYLHDLKMKSKVIGLIPTMGALHEGHLSLIKSSRNENDITIATIFVNPTQFNNESDLAKYPKTIQEDMAKLKEVGCDAVFCPDSQQMYPEKPELSLDFGDLATDMEGKYRPGHFSGVGLVVSKLFNIVNPDRAYFGQKDLQQFFVIQRLVKDLSFDIELRCEPIVRQKNGLAMSSRNMRLSVQGKENASQIFNELQKAGKLIRKKVALNKIKEDMSEALKEYDIELEYFNAVDAGSMALISNYGSSKRIALCLAAFIEGVRLIDNIIVDLSDSSE